MTIEEAIRKAQLDSAVTFGIEDYQRVQADLKRSEIYLVNKVNDKIALGVTKAEVQALKDRLRKESIDVPLIQVVLQNRLDEIEAADKNAGSPT